MYIILCTKKECKMYRKYKILMLAVSRISPRMAIYMLRRTLRNRLAVILPNIYRNRIQNIENNLPKLKSPINLRSSLINIGEFYHSEYVNILPKVKDGILTFLGREIDFGSPSTIEWDINLPDEGDHQLWNTKLAHMGFVAAMILEGKPDYQDTIKTIVSSAHSQTSMTSPGAFRSFWFPYAASHRILSICSAYLIATNRGLIRPDVSKVVEEFIRLNVAFLIDNIEHELCNNHVERNLAAISLYFTYVDKVPAKFACKIERYISHIVMKTILSDGVQIERSPMYQGLSMASLDVIKDATFLTAKTRHHLRDTHSSVSKAFSYLCHPDGGVAMFNDAWDGEVPHYKGGAPSGRRIVLEQGGYARLYAGGDFCLLDAGPLGPSWNPGHGHSDFLSIEISIDNERLVVDPGTSRYNSGPERARERSAAAHNGPTWKGYEPVDFLGCFKVGRTAQAELISTNNLDDSVIAGKFRDRPGIVARGVQIFDGQGFLVGDYWKGEGNCEVNWLLPESWLLEPCPGGFQLKHLQKSIHANISFISGVTSYNVTKDEHALYYGRRSPANRITVSAEKYAGYCHTLTWFGRGEPSKVVLDAGKELLFNLRSALN